MKTFYHHNSRLILLTWALFLGLMVNSWAAAPEFSSFGRDQKIHHTPAPDRLLRIWMVYVDQGDGLIIQLPTRHNYDPDPEDSNSSATERIDILIDGGSNPTSEAWRMTDFIEELYGVKNPMIEYAVISHHDQDHVAGLTYLLNESKIGIETIFHNGLASYRGGKRGFPATSAPSSPAIYQFKNGRLRRGMAFLHPDGNRMKSHFLINNLQQLSERYDNDEFQGVYDNLAEAVVSKANPRIQKFVRVSANDGFVKEDLQELNRGGGLDGIRFEILWPLDPCRKYGNWGETINGNSITFRMDYGDFSMLFTGDHNEKSQEAMLEHLGDNRANLICDVFKVPHHGSSHAHQEFFEELNPVLSVASLGSAGFRSKKVYGNRGWQHPSTEVIHWLGDHHRVYCTEIHEKKFEWSKLTSKAKHEAMKEYTHILIETDGTWFRLVELPDAEPALIQNPPTVQQTRRSNGTRWIRAK